MAQELNGSVVLNDQVQTGDVLATQELIVGEATDGVVSATSAVGNSVSAVTENQNLSFQSSQILAASVASDAYVQTQGTSGAAFVNGVSSTGNTGYAATCCGYLSADVHQTVAPYAAVTSYNFSATGGTVEHASGSSTAIGNSQGYAAVNGTVGARTVQQHGGATNAYNQTVTCCITGSGQYAATAVANTVNSHVENGQSLHEVRQTADGYETRAVNDVYVVTGNEVTGAATASANVVTTDNTGDYAELVADQTNQGLVEAESLVQLDTWYGTGSSIAYGVGNSIALSNVSPDPVMRTTQLNNGDVNSYATFNGGAGEDVFTSASAIGNTVSGYACASCYGVLDANNRQENNGTVRAQSRTTAGSARFVTGTATAVGNTASYESYSGN